MPGLFSVVLLFVALFQLAQLGHALYDSKSPVKHVGEKDFSREVLQHDGIVMVEFYAPWCGHCKSLAPEFEKAAKHLKGVVKILAVDATVDGSLAQKYGVQGYPTLKLFGADKKKPIDYQGQRTGDAIVTECMKATNQLVKDRKAGKAGSSGGGSSGGSAKPKAPPKAKGSGGGGSKGSAVIELTDDNFKSLVTDSADHWLIEFYAPWCGHCKNLAPEWEEAAKKLQGSVKLGAVDATVHTALAGKYKIQGFPSIKLFSAGPKKRPQDYNGPREAQGIVEYALKTLDDAGVPIVIPQVTGQAAFDGACKEAKICVVMTVPHILDSGAKGRNALLDTLQGVAKAFRGKPIAFVWTEGGAQPALEAALDVNLAYPAISIVSVEKQVYATQRASWSTKNINAFLNGILSGSEKKSKLAAVPAVVGVDKWDGKDAQAPQEELSLEDIMG